LRKNSNHHKNGANRKKLQLKVKIHVTIFQSSVSQKKANARQEPGASSFRYLQG